MTAAAPLEQPFAGSLVLAPSEPAPLLLLNPAARLIWEGLRDGRARAEVEAALAAACAISEATARAQVAAVEAEWRNAGLLAGAPHPPPPPPMPAKAPAAGSRRVYALCGTPIAVRFAPPALEAIVAPRFRHARADARPAAELTLARRGDGYALYGPEGASPHATEEGLIGAFVRRYVELSYPGNDWLAVLHAAAVTGRSGDALLLPGPNGSGKSTLVAGLLAAGFGYLSDDCVPIARDGRAVPVPFALCLKRPSWPVAAPLLPAFAATPAPPSRGDRRYVPVRPLVRHPCLPRRIVFPRYVAAAAPRLEPLDPVDTLGRLVAGRAWISRDPDNLSAALGLLERLPAHALTYGRLSDAVEALAAMPDPGPG
jgi:energy-coupling factor transporter ATP-binding protein EcfA2